MCEITDELNALYYIFSSNILNIAYVPNRFKKNNKIRCNWIYQSNIWMRITWMVDFGWVNICWSNKSVNHLSFHQSWSNRKPIYPFYCRLSSVCDRLGSLLVRQLQHGLYPLSGCVQLISSIWSWVGKSRKRRIEGGRERARKEEKEHNKIGELCKLASRNPNKVSRLHWFTQWSNVEFSKAKP